MSELVAVEYMVRGVWTRHHQLLPFAEAQKLVRSYKRQGWTARAVTAAGAAVPRATPGKRLTHWEAVALMWIRDGIKGVLKPADIANLVRRGLVCQQPDGRVCVTAAGVAGWERFAKARW